MIVASFLVLSYRTLSNIGFLVFFAFLKQAYDVGNKGKDNKEARKKPAAKQKARRNQQPNNVLSPETLFKIITIRKF